MFLCCRFGSFIPFLCCCCWFFLFYLWLSFSFIFSIVLLFDSAHHLFSCRRCLPSSSLVPYSLVRSSVCPPLQVFKFLMVVSMFFLFFFFYLFSKKTFLGSLVSGVEVCFAWFVLMNSGVLFIPSGYLARWTTIRNKVLWKFYSKWFNCTSNLIESNIYLPHKWGRLEQVGAGWDTLINSRFAAITLFPE